jgi:hypothetical protein
MNNLNKRIVAIGIIMLIMCAMAVSVFADENRYQVVVVYETRGIADRKTGKVTTRPQREEVSVTVTASSVAEAESKAKDLVQAQKNSGKIISANAIRL